MDTRVRSILHMIAIPCVTSTSSPFSDPAKNDLRTGLHMHCSVVVSQARLTSFALCPTYGWQSALGLSHFSRAALDSVFCMAQPYSGA